ncbi:MAG: putative ABC transporter ATP-binding protein [Deltaproteobacteria bacterium ADurb.Bin510]|nr:MAG: putative ABC transporter ATP-binding protein [Deltaproteobacteria bacterium ADurb.Bin510]
MESALAFHELCYAYAGGAPVFDQLTAELQAGQLVALMGGNGSGKTTLLKCLAGLLPKYGGSIHLGGLELGQLSRRSRARRLSLVPQDCAAGFGYLVRDMVLMGRAPYIAAFGGPGPADVDAAQQALKAVGLESFGARIYSRLSGGERQLVLIARALAQAAPIMLLDEPTSHLDFRNQVRVMRTLRDLVSQRGLSVIMATHDPNLVLSFAERVLLLHEGRLIADGAPEAVLTGERLQAVYGVALRELHADGRLVGLSAREKA